MPDRTAAQEASAYFNSLPIEQRRRLAPLLEDYRLLGMRQYAQAIDAARSAMSKRMRGIETLYLNDSAALGDQQEGDQHAR